MHKVELDPESYVKSECIIYIIIKHVYQRIHRMTQNSYKLGKVINKEGKSLGDTTA